MKSDQINWKLLESGKTEILDYPAYFIHYKSDTDTYGELQSIVFIVESKEDDAFYHLSAGASQTKELEKNMAVMIKSLTTFKIQN